MSKNGLILLTPTSIAYTGTSATVSANGSVSFSACSSLRLNGIFSADYDNYTVVISGKTTAGDLGLQFQLSASGVDASGSNYTFQRIVGDSTTASASRTSSATAGTLGFFSSSLHNGDVVSVYGPYLTQPTATRNTNVDSYGSASLIDYACTHSVSLSYDGLRIFVGANAITGRVAVYGMRK